jgi:phosphate transport system substrate-binding protein
MTGGEAGALQARRSRSGCRLAAPFALLALLACAPSGSERGRGRAPACEPEDGRPSRLIAAGSGTNLALVRELVRRFAATAGGERIEVPESIGTGGAARALLEGAIDIGLASRRLTAGERESGLVELPLARTVLAVALHAGPPVDSLTARELVDIYAGRRTTWPDGTPIVPLLREAGDSSERVLAAAYPEVGAALAEARRAARWIVCYTDQEMRDALLVLEGALGLLDLGTVRLERLSLQLPALDGVLPTPENAAAGRYPLVKDLALLTRGPPAGAVAGFVTFAASTEASAILAEGGYLPPARGAE